MEGGGFAAAWPSIVRKESDDALAWNRGHLPFKPEHVVTWSSIHSLSFSLSASFLKSTAFKIKAAPLKFKKKKKSLASGIWKG